MDNEKNDKYFMKFKVLDFSGKIFLALNIFLIFYYVISLIWLVKYKNWYIIKQRNFKLTFIGGIANFISTFSNSATQVLMFPCAYSYYSATIATVISQICFTARSLRLIFLYKLNIFKVTELSQKKFIQNSKNATIIEPNIYYKSIYKLVDKRIVQYFIFGLVALITIVSVIMHARTIEGHSYQCSFTEGIDVNSKISNINIKLQSNNTQSSGQGGPYSPYGPYSSSSAIPDDIKNQINIAEKIQTMFKIPVVAGTFFIIMNIIIFITFIFTNIKDDQKLGIKFDCFSNSFVHSITQIIYFLLEAYRRNGQYKVEFIDEFDKFTKNGILLFIINGFYLHLTSVIIPIIKCIKAKRLDKKYEKEPTNTMQYFYKILNSQNLVEELKAIAIQEFVVENVLFWENYCILQKLVTRAKQKQETNGDSSSNSHHQKLTLQDIYSQNSSHDDDSYDPNYPLMPQLVPYFNAFYHTFIDIDGPAAVNISGSTVRRIYHDFYTYPTVGIFDEAKDEVVESMYFSIFPILLQQNRKQLGDLYTHH